ncbi:pyrimidine 5-nucleotidase [Suhomyces tanzawaensis NRRL Y-17324]|uniref:Pyrimidine 5-nucleotidase n=1 Tax=Suhomyces tanzawaensis NRRL Y-17324 TaxID=984487 RepID=A0A1E4SGR9_9ASCO|nr:pyrimidine 5-nucleotidase [Suhomyces tanzawaensis NRRL Y-17324]ODV78698.1 pyrimidine 5-nucleotidase [Suhomyces tanzawaensis NRRL Y-17324]
MTLPAPVKYVNPEVPPSQPGASVELPYGFGPLPEHARNKKIFYFDIDNCLYRRSTQIHDMMQVKIHQFFKDNLQLNDEDAHKLHILYYQTYGLAIEGLVRNHQIDALEYNSKVDDSLDLKSALSYNQELRDMLLSIKNDHDYDHLWLITNAYKNHALRVISFLGLGDLFDGLTFCDYSKFPIVCKPMPKFFNDCLATTNVDFSDKAAVAKQTFIDDSEINVKAAHDLGFGTVIHYVEIEKDLARILAKDDFEKYYGNGDNSDKSKIQIIKDILDLKLVI